MIGPRSACILSALAAVCTLAARSAGAGPLSGAGQESLPLEGVITEPDWASRPSGNDVSRFYPPLATVIRLPGRTEISCAVTTLGALSGCVVIAEVPAGMGFGEAAISLSALFRMRPRMLDGQPVPGGTVRIPIPFAMAPDSDAPSSQGAGLRSAPASSQSPSPAALALSRRLVTALKLDAGDREALGKYVDGLRAQLGASGPTREQQLALDAFQQVLATSIPDRVGVAALSYAESMSESELSQAVAFAESPAGKAFIVATDAGRKAVTAEAAQTFKALAEETRSRLCRQITCLSPGAPAPQGAAPGARKP